MSADEHEITITIKRGELRRYSDQFLATAWHVAQANPARHGDREAGELAEMIGREIIRRWVKSIEPAMYHHQGRDYYWDELRQLGKWKDGVFVPSAAGDDAEGGAS